MIVYKNIFMYIVGCTICYIRYVNTTEFNLFYNVKYFFIKVLIRFFIMHLISIVGIYKC